MVKDLIVTRSIMLNASPARVWEALTHPGMTKHYMFNCEVHSNWDEGGDIIWTGTFNGQDILQKGKILEIIPEQVLRYSTFDPNGDGEDIPENYIHVSYEIKSRNGQTELLTTLENFGEDDSRAEYAAEVWDIEVLPKLKELIETTL
jgi:uncharacterized protein YndB with AHSA1/START domain